MFASLRSRLWLSFAFLIAVVLLVTAISLLVFVARANLGARVELRRAAERILQRPEQQSQLTLVTFDEAVERIDENINFRTMIANERGVVVADSRADELGTFPLLRRLPVDPLADIFLIRDADGETWLYTGQRIGGGYTFLIAEQRQPLREMVSSPLSGELLSALGQSGLVAFALALLLALLISNSIASPLRTISEAAKEVAEGRQITVKPAGPREVQQLGESFNQMSLQVHASYQSQRDFVANVSHELKTPLTSVQGFAQAIMDGTAATPDAQKQAAQVIYDEAGRMHRMVLDLLDLAKLDAGTADLEMDRVSLNMLLDSVIERFTPQSQAGQVALVAEYAGLPDVIGDGDRLAQVFNNLVDNALKHTPPGGKVRIDGQVTAGQVQIQVKDSGPGIPPEELSR
ncbi:MAG TPA: HAMP domain-containing sensor histidine kinase, partial [Anaerolineales bacterium]|nr:HAMP domain-containing sensor histidine kinase [Anaerolineales bacterium]